MPTFEGIKPDPYGRRKWLFGLVGPLLYVPVTIKTMQDEFSGRWEGKISGDSDIEYIFGITEALKLPPKSKPEIGFGSHEDLLAAIGRRGVTIINEIIEQTSPHPDNQ